MDRGRSSDLHPTRVYRYRLRSILRRRWPDYALLVLLIALVGGLAMGSVVAGRRTQSAYASFLARDHASTLTLSTYGLINDAAANNFSPRLEQEIRSLPQVAKVESWVASYTVPIDSHGAAKVSELNGVNVAGSVDGAFFDLDRVTVIKGRMANRADPHEFMASAVGARLLGIHLGQTVEFGTFDETALVEPGFGTAAVQPKARYAMRLVAIIEFNNDVVEDDTDHLPTNLVMTPALTKTEGNQANGTWFAIRLKPGVKNVAPVEHQMLGYLPAGALGQFYLTSVTKEKVESALRPESIALGVFGLIAALAVLGLCIPIIARLKINSEDDRGVLRSLGATRPMVAADSFVGIAGSVLVGTVLACGVAAGLGSLAPLGPVHTVYHPGTVALDWTVTGLGIALLTGTLLGIALVMALRAPAAGRDAAAHSRAPRVSRAVDAVAAAGLPVPAVVGARLALESGHGRTSAASRSVVVGGILSVTLVVATLTFASGLKTLVDHPALYGWDWGYTLLGNSNIPPDATAALQHDPAVDAWSGYIAITVTVDGRSLPVLIATNGTDVTPPIVSGHKITSRGQILLGPATLAALHKRIGDTVPTGFGSPATAPLYLPPQPLKIVGTATFPAVAGASNFADHTSMGVGGLFAFASLPTQFVQGLVNPDPVQNGPVLVFVRYRPGIGRHAALADVKRIIAIADRQFASDPTAAGDGVSYLPVERPAAIVNYQSTGASPLILAFGLAAASTLSLALSMLASVRRRRRDLAVLKALGFDRRQLLATVTSQALVIAALAVAIGVPLGIAAGRQLWIAFARNIYAVPKPTVPASVALVALGAAVIAIAVAMVPGRLAARTPAAAVLRAD